jgi:hypothetical protein
MSAQGQTRTSERFRFMSAQVPQAEIQATQYDVAVVPKPDVSRCGIQSKGARYSITSLARASSVGGTLRPRARAVGRFIANTNLADCTTGKSAGFSPLMIRPA